MGRESTRQLLIEAGCRIFAERGYTNSGIEAIIQSAGVPKGSFYYYFGSKEQFGLGVIDRFAEVLSAESEVAFSEDDRTPMDRFRAYFEAKVRWLESKDCRNGCLLGTLSQEMADQSEVLRARLVEVFDSRVDCYARCLASAQRAGQLSPDADVRELAEFCICGWQGALLRAKTTRSPRPLETFLNTLFGRVLPSLATPARAIGVVVEG